MMMAMTITANAMSYNMAKNEALFLSDKMAYELNLTSAQYDAVYEINLDYMMSVNGLHDVYGTWWNRRNPDLMYVLTVVQYNKYKEISYFYRPLTWKNGNWTFNIYSHYTNKNHFYKARPNVFVSYRGGNNHKDVRYYADKKMDKNGGTKAGKHGDVKKDHRGNQHSANNGNLLAHNTGKGNNTTSRRGR